MCVHYVDLEHTQDDGQSNYNFNKLLRNGSLLDRECTFRQTRENERKLEN